MDVSRLEEQLEGSLSEIQKMKQQIDEKTKQVKVLKKTLFAYEIVSKQPEKAPVGTSYYKCVHCSKAFSSQSYLDSHVSRRHTDEPQSHQSNITEKKKEVNFELEKVVQLMEKFTANLGSNAEESKVEEVKKLMSNQLDQERLRFESELQNLKTLMHRELEEERAFLKRDREALERIVNENRKNAGVASKIHVGDLEDDEKTDTAKPKKPTSKPPSTRPKRNQIEVIEKRLHQEYEKELENIQHVISDQVGRFKQHILVENEIQNQNLEKKLKMASNEIERLKAFRMVQSDSIDITDIKSPHVYTKDRKLIWKNYMTALDGFKNTPNPELPAITSKYLHAPNQVENEKEIIQLEVDRFLAEQGLSEANLKKMSSDPVLKNVATGLSNYISTQRAITNSEVLCYEEMRSLIESQVEKAAVSTLHFDRHPHSATGHTIPPLPRRSSMKKTTSSPTKSVKIAENCENEMIEPKKGLRALNLQIPPDGFNEHTCVLTNSSVANNAKPGSPPKARTDVANRTTESIRNAFSSLTSRTLGFSKSKSKGEPKFDQEAMGFRKFQLNAQPSRSPSPTAAPVKYMDITKSGTAPLEHSEKSISDKETATTSRDGQTTSDADDLTSDIDITELSSAKQEPPPTKSIQLSVNNTESISKDKESVSDVSFDVSEVSDTDSIRDLVTNLKGEKKLLVVPPKQDMVVSEESDFGDDFDDFDDDIVKAKKLNPSTVIHLDALSAPKSSIPNLSKSDTGKPASGHQQSVKTTVSSNNDDDVLEFLDEIDASLGEQINKTKKEIPHIDDIDDFDSI